MKWHAGSAPPRPCPPSAVFLYDAYALVIALALNKRADDSLPMSSAGLQFPHLCSRWMSSTSPPIAIRPLRDRRKARIRFGHQRQRAGYGRRSVHSARRRAQGHLCGWRHQRDLSGRIDLVRQFPLRATAAGAACGHRCRRPLPASRRQSRAALSADVRSNTNPAAAR